MEWHGINLSDYHEQKWLKQSIKSLWLTIFTIIVAAIIAVWVLFETQHLANTEQKISSEISQLNRNLQQFEQKIHLLKNQHSQMQFTYIEKQEVQQFIRYLTEIPVKGFIENVQLYLDNGIKLKMVGKMTNENTFEIITQQLKQENFTYKIDHFEKNEQDQLEFSLIINLTVKNETVD